MTKRQARTMTATSELRVATYLRISTDEEHQPFSLDAQRQRLGAFVASQPGWSLTASYTDQFSGAYAARPGLDEALRDARLGRFDVLLVYRVDRFARSLKVLVGLLEELEGYGVAFRSATEPIDTATAAGRMLVQLLDVFAEFERATIIDRVVAGMERKAARGHWPGGRLPYGLAVDADKRLVANPAELPLVEVVFDRYANGHLGAERIAGELNEQGHRTRSGRPFSRQVILGILRNRSYLGEVTFRGTTQQSSAEPIIDPDLFARAEALLAERGEGYAQRFVGRHPDYLLSGLITCGQCRRRYVGVSANGHSHRYRYYVCWGRNRYGKGTCDSPSIRADELEAAVFAALVDLYADPALLTDATASQRDQLAERQRQHDSERRSVEGQIRKTEAAVERYMASFERGTLSDNAFGDRVRELGRTITALRARRAELAEAVADQQAPLTPDAIAATRCQLQHICTHAPETLRKAVAKAFVDELRVVDATRVQPRFRVLSGLPEAWLSSPGDAPEGGVRTMTSSVGAT